MFSAGYALSPYIKQTRSGFKGLMLLTVGISGRVLECTLTNFRVPQHSVIP